MRCYHFSYFYLSPIQQGIQAAHAQMEMFVKYQPSSTEPHLHNQLIDWAQNHKTMICLNAGMQSMVEAIHETMSDENNMHPWACFYEEAGAVSPVETLTNVCVVLPEKIYNNVRILKDSPLHSIEFLGDGGIIYTPTFGDSAPIEFSPYEVGIMHLLNQCRLA